MCSSDLILSTTIIVGPANLWMLQFHERMPVILDPQYFDAWLTGENPSAAMLLSKTHDLQEWIVSKRVNRTGAYDSDSSLIEEIGGTIKYQ